MVPIIGSVEGRSIVEQELERFAMWAGGPDRIKLSEIELLDRFPDLSVSSLKGGEYRPEAQAIRLLDDAASIPSMLRHELCHALDSQAGGTFSKDGLFTLIVEESLTQDLSILSFYDEEDRQEEAFAYWCEPVPESLDFATRSRCGGDATPSHEAARHLLEHVWTSYTSKDTAALVVRDASYTLVSEHRNASQWRMAESEEREGEVTLSLFFDGRPTETLALDLQTGMHIGDGGEPRSLLESSTECQLDMNWGPGGGLASFDEHRRATGHSEGEQVCALSAYLEAPLAPQARFDATFARRLLSRQDGVWRAVADVCVLSTGRTFDMWVSLDGGLWYAWEDEGATLFWGEIINP